MAENSQNIFREKTLERISSPEQLTDYLRVTSPGIWVVLATVILLLTGIFAWSAIGTLETTASVTAIVKDHSALVIPLGSEKLTIGMKLRVEEQDFAISAADIDEYGRSVGTAQVSLEDGTYSGEVVTETFHPISFLIESK